MPDIKNPSIDKALLLETEQAITGICQPDAKLSGYLLARLHPFLR
jgi:hypothetical protein